MQPSPTKTGQSKTFITAALILVPFALFFVFVVGSVFMTLFMPGHRSTRTAHTKPQIVSIEPMTWTEGGTTIVSGKPGGYSGRTASRDVSGFRVTYKFNTADGQNITHTDERKLSTNPVDLAQVCYDPKDPQTCIVDRAGECY